MASVSELHLHVRARERLLAPPQQRGLGEVGRPRWDLPFRLVDQAGQGMVMQVAADARHVLHHLDPSLAQFVARPDTGEQQQAR